jgi:hypothetical protein
LSNSAEKRDPVSLLVAQYFEKGVLHEQFDEACSDTFSGVDALVLDLIQTP